MVLDLKDLKDLLDREIMQRMDHRNLNVEVPELAGKIPTCENIALVIWNLLEPKIPVGKLHRVRLYESADLFADCYRAAASNGHACRRKQGSDAARDNSDEWRQSGDAKVGTWGGAIASRHRIVCTTRI